MREHDKTQIDIVRDLGINRSSISSWVRGTRLPRMDKVDLLAQYFGVKRSDLIETKDLSESEVELNKKDKREILNILNDTREQLISQEGLMFDGEPATDDGVQAILDALEIGLEIAKKRNKEKYTNKRYKKC